MITKFKKIKALVFLFLIQLSFTFAKGALASSIKTEGLDKQDQALMGPSGLAGNTNLATIISVLIQVILGFLGTIFLILTISAGFKWMASQGNEKEIAAAKSSIKNSVIGLLIVIAAYAITYSVFNYLPFTSNGTGGGGSVVTP